MLYKKYSDSYMLWKCNNGCNLKGGFDMSSLIVPFLVFMKNSMQTICGRKIIVYVTSLTKTC